MPAPSNFIPVNQPLLNGNEALYLRDCVESGWISSEGPYVQRFEEAFSQHLGGRECITVSNGSDALDLAVAVLDLQPGDEVILPAFTIISCVQAILRSGATPVLVDCDPLSWNMTPEAVAARITPRTRAIMAVHIYGLPVDMDPILEVARPLGIKVIEDAAEAIGLTYKGRRCGALGDIATFSFFANKHVATGEGGMVATADPAFAARCRSLRNLAFGPRRFVHEELGWNMRLTNLQAAVGLAQIERLEHTVDRKRRMGARYFELLEGIRGCTLPLRATPDAENVFWVFGLVLDDDVPFDAGEAMKRLGQAGIGTRPFFWPLHEQPVFCRQGMFAGECYPVSERLARRGFYVPSGVAITDAQIERVAAAVRQLLA